MSTKRIGAKVKVKGKEGVITGAEYPQQGSTGKIRWKVKLGKAEGKWYDDDQVAAIN
jgi:hypothetical protein